MRGDMDGNQLPTIDTDDFPFSYPPFIHHGRLADQCDFLREFLMGCGESYDFKFLFIQPRHFFITFPLNVWQDHVFAEGLAGGGRCAEAL